MNFSNPLDLKYVHLLLLSRCLNFHPLPGLFFWLSVYFHYFINNDIDKLDKKFKEHLDSERQKNNLIVDDDDNEIKYMMNCIKKQQKYFYDSKTTLNETKKGIFMILCLPNGEMPVLIDDVGANLTFKREDNESIIFKTTNYIE